MTTRSFASPQADNNSFLPRLLGTRGAVACEHHLAAYAARDILQHGGNAVDAGVSAVLVEGLVNPHNHTLGGECPMLIYHAKSDRVIAVNGNTAAPERASAEAYAQRGFAEMPDEGVLAAGVPAALHAMVSALSEFGSMDFASVAAPALELARNGFAIHRGLAHQPKLGLHALAATFADRWPGSAALYMRDGKALEEGAILRNSRLADVFDTLVHAESCAGGTREQALSAVLDEFYRGDVAREIATFCAQHDAFLERSDLQSFETHFEAAVSVRFCAVDVFKCGAWNQGPALLQALAILRQFDLRTLGHNKTQYLHLVIEAINLAFADREQFYADPRQVSVPLDALLSDEYAVRRAKLIDPHRASEELRPGDPQTLAALLPAERRLGGKSWGHGTVHVDVIDADGNMVAMTPSGAWLKSNEVMPALGFPLGNRLMTFYLSPEHHPNRVAPFKRPRTTISPTLLYRDGRPWMVFGSMGGDQQDQWMLQFLLNVVVFGQTLQDAIEAPKLSSEHFPGFFAPHDRVANQVAAEPRIGAQTLQQLATMGHRITPVPDWSEGYLLAASRDAQSGLLEAACDPRGSKGDVFPACALCW